MADLRSARRQAYSGPEDNPSRGLAAKPAMLASVLNAHEAIACLNARVDIIDCKDPSKGALGALSPKDVKNVVTAVNGALPVSATVGDLPAQVEPILKAVRATAALGVDFVKVGLFPSASGNNSYTNGNGAAKGDGVIDVIKALGRLELPNAGLVAVLLADHNFAPALIKDLAAAGFAAVMVDTADKSKGSLLDVLDERELNDFIQTARSHGLLVGLAGRLRRNHIAKILKLDPDIVGFRGALCPRGERSQGLDPHALQLVRSDIPSNRAQTSLALNAL